jgi:hypothetical protein
MSNVSWVHIDSHLLEERGWGWVNRTNKNLAMQAELAIQEICHSAVLHQ